MSVLLWGVAGVLLGILLFFGFPLMVAQPLGYDGRRALSDQYFKLAFSALRRGGIVERENGGADLVATEFQPKMDAEEIKLDGKTGHAQDRANVMRSCYKKPFFVVSEKVNAITNPFLADVGYHYGKAIQRGEDEEALQMQTDEGVSTVHAFKNTLDLPDETRLVSLHDTTSLIPGSADLWLGEQAYEFGEKSQVGFIDRKTMEYMVILGAYALGFALPVLTVWQLGVGGGGGLGGITDVAIMTGVGV